MTFNYHWWPMSESKPLPVESADSTFLQCKIDADLDARLTAAQQVHGFTRSAFLRLALIERLERYEQMITGV